MSIKVDLTKQYYRKNAGNDKDSVFTLDVKFEAGNELVVLFGRSGSGKTTALQCISGLLKPDRGTIHVNGRVFFDPITGTNLPVQERGLGYVFQNYALFLHMDVKKNIAYGLKGWSSDEKEKRTMEMLRLLQIEGLENRVPSQLSGGQKQRTALARALAPNPSILLLDEPFSALDMVVRIKLRDAIKRIQKELGITILFITHNHEEAFTLADKMVIFHKGKVQQTGTPEEVFYNPTNIHVAELVGMTNIFEDCTIEEDTAQNGTILLCKDEFYVRVEKGTLKTGEKASWGIRPENVRILPKNHMYTEDLFNVTVASIINKGASKQIVLMLEKCHIPLISEVSNQIFEELHLKTGDLCQVRLDKGMLAVF